MRYLITGGSGFLGQELIKRLVAQGHEVVVVARNEGNLIALTEEYPVEIIPGDISDRFVLDVAMKGVDGVFHLAAFKHVGLAETNSRECIKSNVEGSLAILEASMEYKPEFVVGVSTDKAAKVNGVYGATKLLMEALFKEYEKANPFTKYRVVRYGNVLYSTGSVLCKWKERLQKGQEIIITDPEATRFYWTVDQAVDLIFDTLENATDSKPRSFPMKAMRMQDLLDTMMLKYGTAPVKQIGLQPGENLHETIDGSVTSEFAPRYTQEEILAII